MIRKKSHVIEYEAVDWERRAEIRSARNATFTYKGKKTLEFDESELDRKKHHQIINRTNKH